MKITKEWGIKIGLVVGAALWLSLVAASWADATEAGAGVVNDAGAGTANATVENDRKPAAMASSAPSGDDEYNFNWLDPEKKIYVLQNRRYLKANRVMLSGMVGTGFSNPYETTYNFDPRVTYYLSEEWGFEAFYTFTNNVANSAYTALAGTSNQGSTVLPVIRNIRTQYGATVQWLPWYAKINVFNKILYFDWYFNGGAGAVNYAMFNSSTGATGSPVNPNEVDQSSFAVFLGTGHIYHITDSLLVRLDFTCAVYNTQIFGLGGGGTWFTNLNFGAGVGWRL
jgi:outer membrane beta-barrel protein